MSDAGLDVLVLLSFVLWFLVSHRANLALGGKVFAPSSSHMGNNCIQIIFPNLQVAALISASISMPSKSSSTGKGKGKGKDGGESGSGKLKAATSINVRHILVS